MENIDEIINNALEQNKEKKWVLTIKGDLCDADYAYQKTTFTDKKFKERGLGSALLTFYLIDKPHFGEDIELGYVVNELLPMDTMECAHTIVDVTVTKGDMILRLDKIDKDVARSLIRDFLVNYVKEDLEFDDIEIDVDETLEYILKDKKDKRINLTREI